MINSESKQDDYGLLGSNSRCGKQNRCLISSPSNIFQSLDWTCCQAVDLFSINVPHATDLSDFSFHTPNKGTRETWSMQEMGGSTWWSYAGTKDNRRQFTTTPIATASWKFWKVAWQRSSTAGRSKKSLSQIASQSVSRTFEAIATKAKTNCKNFLERRWIPTKCFT